MSTLLLFLLAAVALTHPVAAQDYDLIVVGSGMSGLSAASALQKYNVTVLEARNRTGGRLFSVPLRAAKAKIDLGGAWIHGTEGNPITQIAASNGIDIVETTQEGQLSYFDNGTELTEAQTDRSDKLFQDLEDYLTENNKSLTINTTLQAAMDKFTDENSLSKEDQMLLDAAVDSSITMEFAASPGNLSAKYYNSDDAFDGDDAIFPGGYSQVINALAKNVSSIQLNTEVTKITIDNDKVTVTATGPSGPVILTAKAVLVTIPLGVLKKVQDSLFDPPLPPAKSAAIDNLGMGLLDKVILLYDKVFWDANATWIQRVPTGSAKALQRFTEIFNVAKFIPELLLLVAFNAGDTAWEAEGETDQVLSKQAHNALKALYPETAPAAPKEVLVTRWGQDKYSQGSYSFKAAGSSNDDILALAEPAGDRLYFAGEATSVAYPATVHGAYISGKEAAEKLEQSGVLAANASSTAAPGAGAGTAASAPAAAAPPKSAGAAERFSAGAVLAGVLAAWVGLGLAA